MGGSLYNENFIPLKKQSKGDNRRWKDLPCSWPINRINTVKMVILLKSVYRFNTISIKIPKWFFTDIEKKIQEFIWNHKRPQIAKATLWSKNIVEGISMLDFKLHHKARVRKTVWYRHQNKQVDLWSRLEDTHTNQESCAHLILDKGGKKKIYTGKKPILQMVLAKTGCPPAESEIRFVSFTW